MKVTSSATIDAFFHDVVTTAIAEESVETTEATEFYLVGLLCELTQGKLPDEPLSLTYVRASSSGPQRATMLKEVADTSLYVTGLFTESLKNKVVPRDYYASLGEASYAQLSTLYDGKTALSTVFGELAEQFADFMEVMTRVRSQLCIDREGQSKGWLLRDYTQRGDDMFLVANDSESS